MAWVKAAYLHHRRFAKEESNADLRRKIALAKQYHYEEKTKAYKEELQKRLHSGKARSARLKTRNDSSPSIMGMSIGGRKKRGSWF